MPTDGTTAQLTALIAYLLAFAPRGGGPTIGATLGGRLWAIRAPDDAVYPHGTLRFTGGGQAGDDSGSRKEGRIELKLLGRPLKQSIAVEYAADVAEQAFLKYSTNEHGLLDVRALVLRETLEPPPFPGDRSVAHVHAVWAYSWWPNYRTQYAIVVGDAP
ncbi:MAG: hypothetical protein V4617_15125 [Gemmatimonadota bacterium]